MITQFFVCWDYSWQVSSVIPTIILANVGRHWWTLSPSRPNIEYFNEGPSRSRGLFWGDTDHPWPQYPRRLASDDRRATQYCNLEIFPRLTGPGCHDFVTRHTFHVTWFFVTHCTWQYTSRPQVWRRPEWKMLLKCDTGDDGCDDDTTICVCFTSWVFSLGFMMSFSKAESQCKNICHPGAGEKSKAGAGLGFVRHNLTFNVEINFKIWYFTIVKT